MVNTITCLDTITKQNTNSSYRKLKADIIEQLNHLHSSNPSEYWHLVQELSPFSFGTDLL